MAKLLDLAHMCNAVYENNPTVSGWKLKRFHKAKGGLNGFQAASFTNGKETVVAFRGTAQVMDGVADFKLGTGMNSTYFSEGEKFATDNSPTIVTGHSLGGAIAQVVANRGGYVMASFNAPGVGVIASRNMLESDATMNVVRIAGMALSALRHPQQMGRDIVNAFNRVEGINICLQHDAVSKIGNHYGKVKRIPGTGINPLKEHGIETVIKVLGQRMNAKLADSPPSLV